MFQRVWMKPISDFRNVGLPKNINFYYSCHYLKRLVWVYIGNANASKWEP